MVICQNEDGTWGEYEEPYTTVDFKTEEDYKKFEEILNYYNNRTEHDKEVRNKAIDDMANTLIRNSRTEEIDGNICLIVTDKRIKLIAEQLKEGAGE